MVKWTQDQRPGRQKRHEKKPVVSPTGFHFRLSRHRVNFYRRDSFKLGHYLRLSYLHFRVVSPILTAFARRSARDTRVGLPFPPAKSLAAIDVLPIGALRQTCLDLLLGDL